MRQSESTSRKDLKKNKFKLIEEKKLLNNFVFNFFLHIFALLKNNNT